MRTAAITRSAIGPEAVLRQVGAAEDGAVLLFLGTVRRSNDGRAVTGMRYDAYEAMAQQVLEAIVGEAADRWGLEHVVAVHRVGQLAVGEVSAAIAVSAPHRAEAYAASRYVIEEIKQRLPVWKQEHYQDEAPRWLAGAEAQGQRS
jgi:molybdopterin synthase catalytic subunit